jgi:uncharacterized iron-regulated membrane protein
MALRPSPAAATRPAGALSREDDPSREPARPGIARLSLIALLCFAVGLAWPLLAGLDFVQRPPGTNPVKPEESDPPPLDSEPDSKPSSLPPPRPGAPVNRDEGVRAAAHVAPLASAASQRDGQLASDSADRAESSDRIVATSGQATIVWKAAVVRESPSGQAETLDRLLRGSRISVTGRKGDWYRVKYGRPARTGWVHHKALGL